MEPLLTHMRRPGNHCRSTRRLLLLVVAFVGLMANGCAALTNPVAEGLPVRYLSPEFLAKPKDDAQTIPLDLLGQPQPEVYRLFPEDVLGVWIDGVLGDAKGGTPPINVASPVQFRETRRFPPSFGFPIPVREDGTIHLPLIEPIRVQGLSLAEVEDVIRATYVKEKIVPAGRERVIVTLMHSRQTHVVVLRQESANISLGQEGGLAGGKRNTGHMVDLIGYENDVLHSLTYTGGLPGLDAYNEIIIFRGSFRDVHDRAMILEKLRALPPGANPAQALGSCAGVVRIPLRRRPGEELPFGPADIVLHNGDVVFIEARDQDLFYTGGLLPSGEHILPRDYDLDVVKAVLRVRGPLVNGGFSSNNLAGNIITPGLGAPSPALLSVVRRTSDGGQILIRVDLDRALQDPRERILVQAGDVLILQERPGQAISRYLTQTFVNFNLFWKAVSTSRATGVINIAAPDRLAAPVLTTNVP